MSSGFARRATMKHLPRTGPYSGAAVGPVSDAVTTAPAVDGPWTRRDSPFEARSGQWDEWHLSPGPVLLFESGRPMMFYNGGTRDAHWRIGWIEFDEQCLQVVDRGDEPLITPPPGKPGDTDIAFVASAV